MSDISVDAVLREAETSVAGLLGRSGWSLDELTPDQVRLAPDRYVLVRHRVTARDRHGHRRGLSICVEARRRPRSLPEPPVGVASGLGLDVVADTIGHHNVWVLPYDPELAGLPEASSGSTVRARLRAEGLIDGPTLVHARLLRYRPRRRAVFRYQIVSRPGRGSRPRGPRPGLALYGKVLRPDRAARARLVAGAIGPRAGAGRPRWSRPGTDRVRLAVPTFLGDGLFVAPAIAGSSLRDRLLRGGSLPAPDRLASLPGAIAAVTPFAQATLPADDRRHPSRMLEHAIGVLGDVVPGQRGALARAAAAVEDGVEGWQPTGLVHGDLYDDQVFVDHRFRLGLVDLDDVGPGDQAIDAANLCAHLLALAAAVPSRSYALLAYRELVRAAFIVRLDVSAADFAWREALGLLLLATGPFRVQSPRWPAESGHLIDLAVRLTSRDREGPWPTCS